LLGYLLGTQEIELHDAVENIVSRGYKTIINIGAADGYYALGLTRRLPQACVLAYEGNSSHHKYLDTSARANGVGERIFIRGFCRGDDLRAALATVRQPALVICDIEGGEMNLLDPESIAALRSVSGRPRVASDFPSATLPLLMRIFPETAIELMNERREEPQQWLMLTARDTMLRARQAAEENCSHDAC
jgi:hypothetical protein